MGLFKSYFNPEPETLTLDTTEVVNVMYNVRAAQHIFTQAMDKPTHEYNNAKRALERAMRDAFKELVGREPSVDELRGLMG